MSYVRNLDSLGRITIPSEIRKNFGINEIITPTRMEYFQDNDKVILRVFKTGCRICGDGDDLIKHKNIVICRNCLLEFIIEGIA